MKYGAHGLPLMGSGDWNDGMNRVGVEGRGESVWLGWFLVTVLNETAVLCEARDRQDLAQRYRSQARGSPARWNSPGTAAGTGALTSTTARRSARSRTTNAGLVYGVSIWDPYTVIGCTAVIVVVCLLSATIPAFRASRISPAESLANTP